MAQFPGSIPSYAGFNSGDSLKNDNHASQHNSEQADISALATKVGTGSSAPTSGMLLRGNGAGSSAWAQANLTSDVTGVLPQANGGTGTTLATGTGKTVYDTSPTISGAQLTSSPTITTPTIASFANSNHNHNNSAGGGQIANSGISGVGAEKFSNPYKFRASRNAAANSGNAVFAVLAFDTEQYDTGNNLSAGVFTAPIDGFYQFNWQANGTTSGAEIFVASLFKNGTQTSDGTQITATSVAVGSHGSDCIQLTAGDTVDIRVYQSGGRPLNVGTIFGNYFSGFLIGIT